MKYISFAGSCLQCIYCVYYGYHILPSESVMEQHYSVGNPKCTSAPKVGEKGITSTTCGEGEICLSKYDKGTYIGKYIIINKN